MNVSRRTLCALALSALPIAALGGCTGQGAPASGSTGSVSPRAASTSTANGTLRAGVRADVIGFGYLNETTDNYYGLEIDIVNDLAKRMGIDDVEFVTVTPDDRKEMLLAGTIDLVAACYSIAETRLENFDFSPLITRMPSSPSSRTRR